MTKSKSSIVANRTLDLYRSFQLSRLRPRQASRRCAPQVSPFERTVPTKNRLQAGLSRRPVEHDAVRGRRDGDKPVAEGRSSRPSATKAWPCASMRGVWLSMRRLASPPTSTGIREGNAMPGTWRRNKVSGWQPKTHSERRRGGRHAAQEGIFPQDHQLQHQDGEESGQAAEAGRRDRLAEGGKSKKSKKENDAIVGVCIQSTEHFGSSMR